MTDAREWGDDVATPEAAAAPAAGPVRAAKRETSLVPPSTISARSLIMVITIMSFLASMAAGAAVLVGRASQQWSAGIAREVSVQIRAKSGLDMDAEAARVAKIVRATTGVGDVHVFTKAESEGLLEPWLGQDLNFEDLPVPRLIVVTLDRSVAGASDLLRQSLMKDAPNATFDDHRAWSDRLSTMGKTLVLVAIILLLLILFAMALAVAFATSGAMAGSREIVDVLHLVGATDGYISRQYQRQFLVFGLKGGVYGRHRSLPRFLSGRQRVTPLDRLGRRGTGRSPVRRILAWRLGLRCDCADCAVHNRHHRSHHPRDCRAPAARAGMMKQ